jgi:adenine C2-methylase RlmN of 23S rRNA A2503 and tRNA A37
MGLSGNLTMGEILEQIVHADRILASEWLALVQNQSVNHMDRPLPKLDLVRNVVFMGMGEVRQQLG